jgi:hypothetical protein
MTSGKRYIAGLGYECRSRTSGFLISYRGANVAGSLPRGVKGSAMSAKEAHPAVYLVRVGLQNVHNEFQIFF